MNFVIDWNNVNAVLATYFLAVNVLLFIPWRRSFRTMSLITCGIAFLLTLSYIHVYLLSDNPSDRKMIYFVEFFWFLSVILFAKYRDARMIFSLFSVWGFCLAGYILSIIACSYLSQPWLKLPVILIIHAAFTLTICFRLRSSYFSLMRFGKKGWIPSCFLVVLSLLLLGILSKYPQPIDQYSGNVPAAGLCSIIYLVLFIIFTILASNLLNQKKEMEGLHMIAAQAENAERQLQEITKQEKDLAILRHDLRHFAGVITGCIQNRLYDEALESAQSFLSHPALTENAPQFCKNPTLNALLHSYAQKAKAADILFHASVSLPPSLYVDTMDLAVLLSNTLENALNACLNLPKDIERNINVKLYMAGEQLFISTANTCCSPVLLDKATGLPIADPEKSGHGIGLLSVQSFLQKYRAHADCLQKDNLFQLRIVATSVKLEKEDQKSDGLSSNRSILKINMAISALILFGFFLSILASQVSFHKLFKTDIQAVSELTSENIHANVTNLMSRPIHVSMSMAHDTLLRELMEKEAENPDDPEITQTICSYLSAYQEKYGFDTVTLTSAKTGAYYHYQNGISRYLSPDNPEDVWYYEFLNETAECKLNIDNNKVKNYNITIFSDTKLTDQDGKLLGVTSVGIETPYIQQLLEKTETNYNVKAFLIDKDGLIQLSSNLTELERINLFDDPTFAVMKDAILQNTTSTEQKWFSDGRIDGYIITKYIPDLNWYLIVQKDTEELRRSMLSQLFTGFLFMCAVVFIILMITTSILSKYSRILIGQAQKDTLTGLRNRTSYEQEMNIYGGRLSDYAQFGIGIFDLNDLKAVNDVLGHQAGDEYLRTFATLLMEAFPHCPLFRIGGDEFLAVFINISEEEVSQKEKLLQTALKQYFQNDLIPRTAAFGYAFRNTSTLNDVHKLFREADHRMYENKKQQKKSI